MPLGHGAVLAKPSSTWTPASLGANLVWWIDASDAATITFGTGTLVAQIDDKSGNGYHFSQATGGNQLDRNTTQNGLSVLSSPLGSKGMFSTAVVGGTTMSVLAVAMMGVSPSNSRLISAGNGASADDDNVARANVMFRNGGNVELATYRVNAKSLKAITISQWFQASSIFDGTNHTMRIDGVAGTSVGSTGTFNIAKWGLFTHAPSLAAMWIGSIGEAFCTTTALSGADLTSAEAYLKAKWATP